VQVLCNDVVITAVGAVEHIYRSGHIMLNSALISFHAVDEHVGLMFEAILLGLDVHHGRLVVIARLCKQL